MMSKFLFRYVVVLIAVLLVSYIFHSLLLTNMGLLPSVLKLNLSYVVNVILALGIFVGIYQFRKKLEAQIGFLFLLGSMLKFLVFFLVFYPVYNADGVLSRSEFTTFFVPYALCLVIETVAVSKVLKNTSL